MAIFNKKQNTKAKKADAAPAEASTASAPVISSKKHYGSIILAPRITEKSTVVAEKGVYIFNVAKDAGKREISEAVQSLFKVTPAKVRIVPVKGKVRVSRMTNRKGKSASGKKAYVYLKKGETLEIA